jgi:hypothetical protein
MADGWPIAHYRTAYIHSHIPNTYYLPTYRTRQRSRHDGDQPGLAYRFPFILPPWVGLSVPLSLVGGTVPLGLVGPLGLVVPLGLVGGTVPFGLVAMFGWDWAIRPLCH